MVFTKFVEESIALCKAIPNSAYLTGETKKKDREKTIGDFKSGKIKVLANVGILTTGFDYPEVENFHLVENKPGEYAYIGYIEGQWKYLTNAYY